MAFTFPAADSRNRPWKSQMEPSTEFVYLISMISSNWLLNTMIASIQKPALFSHFLRSTGHCSEVFFLLLLAQNEAGIEYLYQIALSDRCDSSIRIRPLLALLGMLLNASERLCGAKLSET